MRNAIVILVSFLILMTSTITSINGSSTESIVKQKSLQIKDTYSSIMYGDGETEYWAVIIEIFDYENDDLDLPEDGNINNRYRIYNATLSAKNWKTDHIRFLSNENATKANILDSFTWLQSNADVDDIVFFFYGGHGSQIPDDDGDEKDGKDETICPHDVNISIEEGYVNFITDDELDNYFDQIDSKGMFLVFDSCLSGGLFEKCNAKIDCIKKFDYSKAFNEELTSDIDDRNRVILASCKEQRICIPIAPIFLAFGLNPYINESDDPYVYLFNLVGIIGYNITADKNEDGLITAEEISRLVKRRVITFWAFALVCPIIKILARIQLIRTYIKTEHFLGLVPQIYDGFEGDLPIVEL